MADDSQFAYLPPTDFAYAAPPPEPLPGITSGAAPRPWGTIDRDRGTPLEQVPETGADNSGFMGTLNKLRRPDNTVDENMRQYGRDRLNDPYSMPNAAGGKGPKNFGGPRDI